MRCWLKRPAARQSINFSRTWRVNVISSVWVLTGLNAYLPMHEKGNKKEMEAREEACEAQNRSSQGMWKTKLRQWHFWVLFGSDLASLPDDVRERETEGKWSVPGDLNIYPPNLLSMDRAVTSLQQIHNSLIAHEDNFKEGDNGNSDRWLKPNKI